MKIMKLPVSRRLNTWNSDIFTRFCPFGCEKEDNEEHALLKCETSIIKDVKNYILNRIKDQKIREKVENFQTLQKWSDFDIIMQDYRQYKSLKTKKKILKCIDRSIKKIVLCNWKNRENRLKVLKQCHRKDMKDENSIKKIKDQFKKIKNLIT